jgi:cobalt-zinc-cadmium efflux system membrane fusion protein
MRRAARALFRAAALVALGGLASCKGAGAKVEPAPTPPPGEVWLTDAQVAEARVKVAPLAEQAVDDVILTSGKVAFEESRVSHVYSPVSGRVTRVDVKTGQRVKKGDVLAVLESPDVGIASSDLQKAKAELIAAEHDLDRQRELLAAHASSQRDYEQAEDAYRKARAEVERAKQKTSLFRAGSANAVSQTYTIRSEIDGEVIAKSATQGIEVAGQYGGTAVELFTIGELDEVWIIADVYEMDSSRVKVGSKVNIKLFAFPGRVFSSTIEWVSGALDPATRTAKVRCVLDNADRALKPEMYATLFISVEERRVLAIPRGALLRLGEQLAVFVEKGKAPDGRRVYARTPVAVDESEGGKWLPVAHGIERGASIVVEGGILLAGGGGDR